MSKSKATKPTATERLANYFKHNKFMTGVVVTGIVAVVAIAGVLAATNNNATNDQTAKPDTSQEDQPQNADDTNKDAESKVATSNTGTSEVLGETTTASASQNQVANTQTVAAVAPATIASNPTQNNATTENDSDNDGSGNGSQNPSTPTNPSDPGTTPTDPTPTNVAPTVTLSAPVNGATVSGLVALNVTAGDDKVGATVQISLDGALLQSSTLSATSGNITMNWDTATATNGSHTLNVVITDTDGVSTSTSATVTVNNQTAPTNTAPTIALVVPASPVSGTITLNATVTDDKAGYTVQYSVDGTNLQSSSWNTTTVADGDHVVVATVTDSEGLTATGTATVTVKNTVVTPPTDPTKYNRALVSLTFDDGWKSIHDNGLPILKKYGLVSTHYINSQPTLDGYSGYNTPQDIKDLADAGNEIAWHTNTHTYDLVTATAAQRTEELTPTAAFLNMLLSINVHMTDNFAAPFGTQNADTAAAAKAAGFNSYRTTYDGYNAKGTTDFMNIKVKNVCGVAGLDACNMLATTPAEVAGWIAEAQAQNTWLVIVFHEVGEFSRATAQANGTFCDADPTEAGVLPDDCVADPSYAVTPANLDAELNAIKQSNVAVVTVQQAIAELKTQQ